MAGYYNEFGQWIYGDTSSPIPEGSENDPQFYGWPGGSPDLVGSGAGGGGQTYDPSLDQYPVADPWDLYDKNTQGQPQTPFTDPYADWGTPGSNGEEDSWVSGTGVDGIGGSKWDAVKGFLSGLSMDGSPSKSSSGTGVITAGNAAAAAAQGRKSEAEIQNDLMRNQISRGALELSQKKYAADVPQVRGAQSVKGDIMANAQDLKLTPSNPKIQVPTISGGMRPSMFSQNTRDLGRELSRSALASQLAGDSFTPVQDPSYPKAGFMENLNNGVAGAGQIGNAVGTIWDYIKALDPNYTDK